jgi:integrase
MTENNIPQTIQELVNEYCASKSSVQAAQTKLLYRLVAKRFDEFLGRPAMLADLNDKTVVAFVRNRVDSQRHYKEGDKTRKLSPYTIEREGNKLLSLWRWAAVKHWAETPTVKFSKRSPKTPVAWSPEELARVFTACRAYNGSVLGIPGNVYFTALMYLLYDTGERSGAVQALRWSDVDLLKQWVTFRADTRKGRGKSQDNLQKLSRRTVKAFELLRTHASEAERSDPDSPVFRFAHRSSLYYHFKIILEAAGLPYDRNCMFHKIRRTFATQLYVRGGDPTQSLGHSCDSMTRMYYLDPRYANRGYAADLLSGGIWLRIGRLFRRLRVACGL